MAVPKEPINLSKHWSIPLLDNEDVVLPISSVDEAQELLKELL